MSTLREYAHPRIGEIVSTLHAQVYWLTRCKQQYLDGGQPGTSEDFAYAEAVARIAVRELDALDQELAPCIVPDTIQEAQQPAHNDVFSAEGVSLLGV